ncbi:gluconeogenesis factor YvcK family protein [Papillibacter cinnamivorans]|uniref:Putative gluconeogenesis factor n=1 Tax=Papillibacter cinnamivorans DSM 12816 TaxID=1122930 RepID=A0A1W1YP02_9FIRM|nr:gluconeogenesis factor YvcK family protein [Papillibacter cinnamivorans]SMC37468.1 conserved hypothetical protein, cofD-related [Papillibacter cinnamivorans DSM 12816]
MLDEKEIDPGRFGAARRAGPRIVAVGGGNGLATMLRGLKRYTENITAVVTVADDGGGSGVLRQELGMLPPGDIRNCILALSNTEPTMEKLLNYRFTEGVLAGQSFGNLFLAALNGISPSFDTAVSRMGEVLAVTGRVLPVTTANVNIEAEFENHTKVLGESKIFRFKKAQDCRILRVRLVPEGPPALPAAVEAILSADMILFGPGSLYTSIIPNLLVEGIADAVTASHALKVLILNIMTQEGETEGYTASDHVKAVFAHSREGLFDLCLANSAPVPAKLRERYEAEGAEPIRVDTEELRRLGVEPVLRPMVSQSSDYARHSSQSLAKELLLLHARRSMRLAYEKYDDLMVQYILEQ